MGKCDTFIQMSPEKRALSLILQNNVAHKNIKDPFLYSFHKQMLY